MLPSKGYFRTIECPFYSNSLCHRVYCHFQHGKKAFSTSSEDSNQVNFVYNNSNNNNMNGAVKDFKCQSHTINDYNVKNFNSNFCKGSASCETIHNKIHKVYLPPQDLPSYNPTPISELKTKNKIVSENKLGLEKAKDVVNDNSNQTKANNFLDFNNSDLANDVAKYLIENDVLRKILTNGINGTTDLANESANNKQLLNSDTLGVSQEKSEHFYNKSNDKNLIKKINKSDSQSENCFSALQSIVNDLIEKEDESKLSEKDVTSKDALIKENDNHTKVIPNTDLNSIGEMSDTLKSNKVCKTAIKMSHGNKGKYEQKHEKHSKSRHKNPIKPHETLNKTNKTVSHQKRKNNNSISDTGQVNKLFGKENYIKKEQVIEVILISDSEESEAYDEFDKIIESIHGRQELNSLKIDTCKPKKNIETELIEYDEFNEILKSLKEEKEINNFEAKHNTYKSQVKTNMPTSDSKKNSRSQKIKTMESVSNKDNDLPQPKKKIRIAHKKAQNNTVTMKTTEEYLSYMENIRERTKYKCVNPSGEEGYQNWSNVKIAPVLNVSSLLSSKKLLHAKFKSLNSNKH